jgi:hypothetical protein
MKLSTTTKNRYPKSSRYIEDSIKFAQRDHLFFKAAGLATDCNHTEIKAHLDLQARPEILHVSSAEFQKAIGRNPDGFYSSDAPLYLFINQKLFEDFERRNRPVSSGNIRNHPSLLIATVFHEYIHFLSVFYGKTANTGDTLDMGVYDIRAGQRGVKHHPDWGWKFEDAYFGKHVVKD